jgi:hypothetical protein
VNSSAKTAVSRRIKPQKHARIRNYTDQHGLNYSQAEERLLDRGLEVEHSLELAGTEVQALFFGRVDEAPLATPAAEGSPFADWDELEREWRRWRTRMTGPFTSWWAYWYLDQGSPLRRPSAALSPRGPSA